MIAILLLVLLVVFLAGGTMNYGRWGAGGLSPAALIALILVLLLLTGCTAGPRASSTPIVTPRGRHAADAR